MEQMTGSSDRDFSVNSVKSKHSEPLMSVITVDYNGFEDTCELIESLLEHIKSVTFEIIVVDNASKKNEAELLKQKYPQIVALRSDENLGFSGGNNLGISHAKGDFLFFLNNDTFVRTDGFRSLIDEMLNNPSIAAVSPKILFAEPGNTIQFAGYTPLTKVTLRNSIVGINEVDDGRWDRPAPTPIVHGAAMLFRKSVLEKIGFMPEVYFLYYEELDWSAAIKRAGFDMWYIPSCVVFHKGSKSTGLYSSLQVFYMTRNRLLYAWRNVEGMYKWISIFYQIVIANTKACLLYLLKGKIHLVKAGYRGIIAFLKMDK